MFHDNKVNAILKKGDFELYSYEYERVANDVSGYGLFSGIKVANDTYKDVINERAKNGWRYVGFIPAVQRGTGHIEEMDLIFEKKID